MKVVTLAVKPMPESITTNVLTHGCGVLDVDASRIGVRTEQDMLRSGKSTLGMFGLGATSWTEQGKAPVGRWPANVVMSDGVPEEVESNAYKCLSEFFKVVVQDQSRSS